MKEDIKKELQRQDFKECRARARQALKGKWLMCAAVTLVLVIIPAILNAWVFVATLIIGLLFSVGSAHFYLEIASEETLNLSNLLWSFKSKERLIKGIIVYLGFVISVGIGLLFLIVPGVIIALAFSQVFFIISENPQLNPLVAFQRSFTMTLGKKRELFCLTCTFIGWFLLGFLTLGIGLLFALPYFAVALADFHMRIRSNQGSEQNDAQLPEEKQEN